MDAIKIIKEHGVVPVLGLKDPDTAPQVAAALRRGGLPLIEVTMRAEKAMDCLRAIKAADPQMLAGAGTILRCEQVDQAKEAGADFIVTPGFNPKVVARCLELGMPVVPGCITPTEIEAAHAAGAEFVKVFPVVTMGPAYIKAIRAPLSHIKMLAVGGINEKNLEDYLKAGVLGAGVGGNLANKEWVHAGEFWRITEVARQLTDIAKKFR